MYTGGASWAISMLDRWWKNSEAVVVTRRHGEVPFRLATLRYILGKPNSPTPS